MLHFPTFRLQGHQFLLPSAVLTEILGNLHLPQWLLRFLPILFQQNHILYWFAFFFINYIVIWCLLWIFDKDCEEMTFLWEWAGGDNHLLRQALRCNSEDEAKANKIGNIFEVHRFWISGEGLHLSPTLLLYYFFPKFAKSIQSLHFLQPISNW